MWRTAGLRIESVDASGVSSDDVVGSWGGGFQDVVGSSPRGAAWCGVVYRHYSTHVAADCIGCCILTVTMELQFWGRYIHQRAVIFHIVGVADEFELQKKEVA